MKDDVASNINTVNGLVFKDDLLLIDPQTNIPTIDSAVGTYADALFIRETSWYQDNIKKYEHSLQKAKCINGMFKESFMDTYHEDGTPTGEVHSYDEIHQNGLWHKAVHVWIINHRGELLLQRRSFKVQTYPGMWENSAGGHIDAGHTSIETAQKELNEELGIEIPLSSFEYIGTIIDKLILNNNTCISNEFDDFYLVQIPDEPMTIAIAELETAETKWIDFRELEKKVYAQDREYVPRQAEYDILFPLLHKRFDNVLE